MMHQTREWRESGKRKRLSQRNTPTSRRQRGEHLDSPMVLSEQRILMYP